MPLRVDLIKAFRTLNLSTTPTYTASFLVPCLQQQRSASILSALSDNKGAYNKRIRRGRGPASGKGKTSGRGHKGQKQHGKVPAGFNGGQTPDEIVNPIRGTPNLLAIDLTPLNVDRLQDWIDQGRLDPSQPITLRELIRSRCIHGAKDGVKLLARGSEQMRTPVNIVISRASASAINAIEAAGGTITTRFYTAASIKRVLRGETDPIFSLQYLNSDTSVQSLSPYVSRLPDPTGRKDIEYYRDPAHRGYLSHQLTEGRGPSLFHKLPSESKEWIKKSHQRRSTQHATENRIW